MKTQTKESAEEIMKLTFNQVKKVTLNIPAPKYDLCKVLSMC